MRISDWSSDVCSSDLLERTEAEEDEAPLRRDREELGDALGIAKDPPERRALEQEPVEERERGARCHGAAGAAGPERDDQHEPEQAAEGRSEEHTSELQSLMRISYAVFCLKKKKKDYRRNNDDEVTQEE